MCCVLNFVVISLDSVLTISSGFDQSCLIVFWRSFSIVPFHSMFVVVSKIKLISHMMYNCSYFECPEIQHAYTSWPPWELIRFVSSSIDFHHFGSILTLRFAISEHFLANTIEEWPQIWHVNVFWSPSEQIRIFRDFPYNAWEELPKIWHVDVSWPPMELHLGHAWSVGSSFWHYFDFLVKQVKCWVSWKRKGRISLKLSMLMYSDLPQSSLHFGHSLLFSSFWHYFDLVKQVRFGGSGVFFKTHRRDSLIFDMLIYTDHLWNWLHLGHGVWVFPILQLFWLNETCHFCSFQAFSWQCLGGMGRNLFFSSLSCDIPSNEKGKF